MALQHVNTHSRYADGPFALVETPAQRMNVHDRAASQFVQVASRMALAHNVIIRGLNSIYKQASSIKPRDEQSFVGYAVVWWELLQAHHTLEENSLFPAIDDLLGEGGCMDGSVAEHAVFHDALYAYEAYLRALKVSPPSETFSAPKLLSLIDDLAPPLLAHLENEIETLLALAEHPHFAQLDEKDVSLLQLYEMQEMKIMPLLGLAGGHMFFFYNLDRGFEGGRWEHWPDMPEVVRWVLLRTVGAWWRQRWRWGSVGLDGRVRVLYGLESVDVEGVEGINGVQGEEC